MSGAETVAVAVVAEKENEDEEEDKEDEEAAAEAAVVSRTTDRVCLPLFIPVSPTYRTSY